MAKLLHDLDALATKVLNAIKAVAADAAKLKDPNNNEVHKPFLQEILARVRDTYDPNDDGEVDISSDTRAVDGKTHDATGIGDDYIWVYKTATSKFVTEAKPAAGGGDMTKAVYDTNDDGQVDAADWADAAGDANRLGGALPATYDQSGEAVAAVSAHELTYDHNDIPSGDEKDALAGTSGAPSAANKYVTDGDARNTNARTPTAHNHVGGDITTAVANATNAGDATTARGIDDKGGHTANATDIESAVSLKHAAAVWGTKEIDETGLADTFVLYYDNASGKWKTQAPAAGGGQTTICLGQDPALPGYNDQSKANTAYRDNYAQESSVIAVDVDDLETVLGAGDWSFYVVFTGIVGPDDTIFVRVKDDTSGTSHGEDSYQDVSHGAFDLEKLFGPFNTALPTTGVKRLRVNWRCDGGYYKITNWRLEARKR